jgi:hypothetical protein
MYLRVLTAAVLVAAAVLCVTSSASAHHQGTASATATSLTLAPAKCGTYERRPASRCDGYRRATVTWTATCPYSSSVTVDYWASRKGGGKPISLASEEAPSDQLSGSTTAIVVPGAHMYATVTVDCAWTDPDGTGPDAHSVSATSAPTAEVVVPPWLREVSVNKGNYCNFDPRGGNVLQAGQRGSILSFSSDFVDKSLLGSGRRTPAAVRQRRLGAKGAGISLRRKPEVFLLQEFGRREPFSGLLRVNARKAGWLKLWEEVGGVKSNTLAIKVVRNRC